MMIPLAMCPSLVGGQGATDAEEEGGPGIEYGSLPTLEAHRRGFWSQQGLLHQGGCTSSGLERAVPREGRTELSQPPPTPSLLPGSRVLRVNWFVNLCHAISITLTVPNGCLVEASPISFHMCTVAM